MEKRITAPKEELKLPEVDSTNRIRPAGSRRYANDSPEAKALAACHPRPPKKEATAAKPEE